MEILGNQKVKMQRRKENTPPSLLPSFNTRRMRWSPSVWKRKSRQDFICMVKSSVSPESNEKATSLAKRDPLK